MTKHWTGTPPSTCDLCDTPISTEFYDARIPRYGSWGLICSDCFKDEDCKGGLGSGQHYRRTSDNRWEKIDG